MNRIFTLIIGSILPLLTFSQTLPDGYILLYQQNFTGNTALQDFIVPAGNHWKIVESKGNKFLRFSIDSSSNPFIHGPAAMGIINNNIFGDFIFEADVMSPVSETKENIVCLFFSAKDSAHYYYVNLLNGPDDHSRGIFLVKNDSGREVTDWKNNSVIWTDNKWHKIKIERNIVNRLVKVYCDNMKNPVMTSRDPDLVMGFIGFGAGSGSACVDNIKIWGPTSIPAAFPIFENTFSR